MADWDPELYNRFRRYRAETFTHMLERLDPAPQDRIVDLGCGSGENTIDLARRTTRGSVLGIDSSPSMIGAAERLRAQLDDDLRGRLRFERADARALDFSGEFTVVFSNAMLQWLPDQKAALAAWHRALRPAGVLAVSMPANDHETAQRTIVALAREEPWRARLKSVEVPARAVAEPDEYRAMLAGIGYVAIDCYYRTFHHPMRDVGELVEWHRATALRAFLAALPEREHGAFLDALAGRLERAYGTAGPLTFDFRRIFLWARRAVP